MNALVAGVVATSIVCCFVAGCPTKKDRFILEESYCLIALSLGLLV